MEKRKKRKIWKIVAILAVLTCLVLAAAGYYLYSQGFRFWSDARPSPAEVKAWTIKNFNPAGYKIWNANPEFDDIEFDTGLIEDTTAMVLRKDKDGLWRMRRLAREGAVIIAPQEGAWGIKAYGWTIGGAHEYSVNAARIQSENGIYKIFTKINQKKIYGNGAAIQGWIWAEPEDTPWNSPLPLLVQNKRVVLKTRVKINEAKTFNDALKYEWQMMSVSAYFTSKELKKSLVIDLAFYLKGDKMWSRESDEGYHYQRVITLDKKEAFGKWKTHTLDFSWFINDAIKRFKIERAADTLQMESLEILSETMYGEAEFEVDSLYLYYKDLPPCACGG